jgi:hypothetical protein
VFETRLKAFLGRQAFFIVFSFKGKEFIAELKPFLRWCVRTLIRRRCLQRVRERSPGMGPTTAYSYAGWQGVIR